LPFLVPTLGDVVAAERVLDRLDGLVLTGSPSNVEPRHYEGGASREGTLHDPRRDATTLPLIRAAFRRGLPILAICRGMQELNVALRGSLHQHVHELPGRLDHRVPEGDRERQFAYAAHGVRLQGRLAEIVGGGELMVNSLHSQGVDRPAPALAVEAVAPDGQVEAVRGTGPGFVIGVQWHPEHRVLEEAASNAFFAAFGAACQAYAAGAKSAN
jgi:putative glutamine amidotransferase